MAKLPNGLQQMSEALIPMKGDFVDRAITLGFVRMFTDPEMPLVAGFDPRVIKRGLFPLVPPYCYIAQDGNSAGWIEALTEKVNEYMGEPLLVSEWPDVHYTHQACVGLGKFRVPDYQHGGDLLGVMLELLRPDMVKGPQGAYYTPTAVTDMMSEMVGPKPGESVLDPCCGSGRMLLSAIEKCRKEHPGEPLPRVYGTDVDPKAITACKLNLQLAGYYVETAAGNGLRDLIAHCNTPLGRIISLRAQHPELPADDEPVRELPRPRRERPTPQAESLFADDQAEAA